MSNALALGAVTAVLKNLLDNAVVNEQLTAAVGPVKVSTLAPDRLKLTDADFVGLNLFLFHLQPNPGWRNTGLPSRSGNGTRLTNPPLALDLFYLVTAWGKLDFEAEILLGYAMQLFHEFPVLTREVIRKTFEANPVVDGDLLPAKFANLAASSLADQFELLKISLHPMGSEETSKLWSAIQVNYRPSVAYQVSVVLIETEAPTRAPFPVLQRSIVALPDVAPAFPTLLSVTPPDQQPAIRLGQTLKVTGHHLGGVSVRARLRHPRIAPFVTAPLVQFTGSEASVPIPDLPAVLPAGHYTIALAVTGASGERTTNELPLVIAPVINIAASDADREGNDDVTVEVKVSPNVLPLQTATLLLGEAAADSDPHPNATDTLTFRFPAALAPPPGSHFVRLRIDGVESIFIDRTKTPPEFDSTQKLVVP
jgi:hypothetical protein